MARSCKRSGSKIINWMSETIVSGGGVSALTTSDITSTIPANSKLQEGKKQSLELIVSEWNRGIEREGGRERKREE